MQITCQNHLKMKFYSGTVKLLDLELEAVITK